MPIARGALFLWGVLICQGGNGFLRMIPLCTVSSFASIWSIYSVTFCCLAVHSTRVVLFVAYFFLSWRCVIIAGSVRGFRVLTGSTAPKVLDFAV